MFECRVGSGDSNTVHMSASYSINCQQRKPVECTHLRTTFPASISTLKKRTTSLPFNNFLGEDHPERTADLIGNNEGRPINAEIWGE